MTPITAKNPKRFRTDEGKIFNVKVTKTNVKTLWITLIDPKTGQDVKQIKTPKTNARLEWE